MAWEKFKKLLEEEKIRLEKELSQIARKNPENPEDWEVKAPEMNPMVSDQSELADMFEELETQAGLEYQLEERLKKVNAALKRIEDGSYGVCTVCGEKIDEKRLEANPLAKNCIKHTEQ
ncbi:MAG: TraR/DksA C4-type zinc finger protein [Patescibacteria group bacterium]